MGAPPVEKTLSAPHGRGGRGVKGSSYVPAGHQSSQRAQGTKRAMGTVCRLLHRCHDDDIVGEETTNSRKVLFPVASFAK